MVKYKIEYSKKAIKDSERINGAMREKLKSYINDLKENPYQPPREKLVGNLQGAYSRRLNIQHRMIYVVDEENKIVRIVRLWTHYE